MEKMTTKVFIDGKAGTTGLRIYERLQERKDIELMLLSEEDRKNPQRRKEMLNSCNIAFLCLPDDASREAVSMIENPDVVVLDPPRKGCSPDLIDTVTGMVPEREVYVPCDPATLARDLKVFATKGYRAQWVQPVDLFPRTAHCENVASLVRQ